MGKNVSEKLIDSHLAGGAMEPGEEIELTMDQTLTQDATGTMVMLEFEAMGIPRVQTKLSAQYVDHNLIQSDYKNPDDHLFLRSACKKFGAWYSRPGNGVSHPVHQERFGVPGQTLIGSDSHSPAAGAIGMLAIGAGGLDVAMAMAGKPYTINMPEVWGVKLTGELPDWVSAKDVILTMLERHDVDGGVGQIIEYYGPGLDSLTCMDRHVIANMGTELGATSTVFPSDDEVRSFLRRQGREEAFRELKADPDATYDEHEEIDLSSVVPKIAKPSSPGNVVSVREVEGQEIYQSYVGSSANPGFRDFASAAEIVEGHQVRPRVVRREPDVAPDPGEPDELGPPPDAHPRRRPYSPGWVQRLHRDGAGARYGADFAPNGAPQLPGPLRHEGRRGVPRQSRDRRGVRPHRSDYRPARPGGPLRHGVPPRQCARQH